MEYIDFLEKAHLFEGIPKKDFLRILSCLSAIRRNYEKGETLIWEGDSVSDIGILLSGSARSTKTDLSGKLYIMTLLEPGSYIGVLLAASKDRKSPVTVEAMETSYALFIPIKNILTRSDCPHHDRLLENLFNGIGEKALEFHDRIDCLIKPSIREKVLTFLTREAKKEDSYVFNISMGRDDMAGYLDVDRSALSRELSWMKRDGLIDYHKSWFKLL